MFRSIFSSLYLALLLSPSTEGNLDIVNEEEVYSYNVLVEDIEQLKSYYPALIEYKVIGETHFGRNIFAVKLGNGPSSLFINSSHHAREWMTTSLVMEMIEKYAANYYSNGEIDGYSVREILNSTSIWFVPMVNPDGVTLQQEGLAAFPKEFHTDLIEMNDGSTNFTRWKANALGIDLNRQYPADWESESDVLSPSWEGYKGERPFQSKETIAIRDFTLEIDPEIAVAYHSSGRILFWYFYNRPEHSFRDYQLAKEFAEITGYRLIDTTVEPSGKGFSDWFIQEFGRPAFTPEIGEYVEDQPVPLEEFQEIWENNKSVGLWLATEAYEMKLDHSTFLSLREKIRQIFYFTFYELPVIFFGKK